MDRNKLKKKLKFIIWAIFVFPIFSAIIIFTLMSNGAIGYIPTWSELENPQIDLASVLYSDDSTTIGKYFRENRTLVNYEDLSPNLVDALICTEDIRFFKHSGIDFRGTARAVVKGILLGADKAGGGSTITQQLAKQLYTKTPGNRIERVFQKLNEWVIAAKLERRYTKEEIMAFYLNYFDFTHQSKGIQSASRVYFNTTPDSLKIEEAAMLVGMLKNPNVFNPYSPGEDSVSIARRERALSRRNIVIAQMLKYKRLKKAEFDSISNLPLEVKYTGQEHYEGPARYFYANIRDVMTANQPQRQTYSLYTDFVNDSLRWLNDPFYGWCNKNFKPNGKPYDLFTDGLQIYSTLNDKFQTYAEEAVRKHLGDYLQPALFREKKGRTKAPFDENLTNEEIQNIMNRAIRQSERYRVLKLAKLSNEEIKQNFKTPVPMNIFSWNGKIDTVMSPIDSIRYYKHLLRVGFISMDPHNGHVKAYVGGIDFKEFQYDHVTSKRQVGSTFKPFLYTLAMQEGLTPCHLVHNTQICLNPMPGDTSIWCPKNSGGKKYEGKIVTLKRGLASSINWISAWVLKQYNPQKVVDMAHKLGIKSYLNPVYSVILGTSDIQLEEMARAYCVFPNGGVRLDPIYVTRIEDKNGNVLASFEAKPTEVITKKTAYLMINMMEGVVDRGTANSLRKVYNFDYNIPIAGKTGTTQNHSDGWFMGITPNLVNGVWVGADDRSVHFDELGMGAGGSMALPIWAYYMQKVLENDTTGTYTEADFVEPEDFNIEVDCEEDYFDPAEEVFDEGWD